MLDPNSITFTERDMPDLRGTDIKALLFLSQAVLVTDLHRVDDADSFELAREQLRRAIWHKLYGDLVEPFERLRELAFMRANPSNTQETYGAIQKAASDISRLLSKPT